MSMNKIVQITVAFSIVAVLIVGVYLRNSRLPVKTYENSLIVSASMELTDHNKVVYCCDWNPSGDMIATGSENGTVIIWNIEDGTKYAVIHPYPKGVWGLAFSPDGTSLATAGERLGVKKWDTSDFQTVIKPENQSNWAFTVEWSPNSNELVAGYANGQVIKFKENGEQVILGNHKRQVISVDYSPDGAKIASGSIDCTIIIWDAVTGEKLITLEADTSARNDINGLEWNPDNRHLAAASQDGYVRIWDTKTGQEIARSGSILSGWKRGVSWSPDGETLAYSGENKKVVLWNYISDTVLAELYHNSPVWDVEWSPDGCILASCSGEYRDAGDTRVIIWNLST